MFFIVQVGLVECFVECLPQPAGSDVCRQIRSPLMHAGARAVAPPVAAGSAGGPWSLRIGHESGHEDAESRHKLSSESCSSSMPPFRFTFPNTVEVPVLAGKIDIYYANYSEYVQIPYDASGTILTKQASRCEAFSAQQRCTAKFRSSPWSTNNGRSPF